METALKMQTMMANTLATMGCNCTRVDRTIDDFLAHRSRLLTRISERADTCDSALVDAVAAARDYDAVCVRMVRRGDATYDQFVQFGELCGLLMRLYRNFPDSIEYQSQL